MRRDLKQAKMMRIRARDKTVMTMIQVTGIGIDLFDNSKFEDESVGVVRLEVVGIGDMVVSRCVRVVVVDRTCEEREAELDEKDAEFEGEEK